MTGRFPIEDVSPVVSCGRYPAKAVVGELVPVSARAYREGHDALGLQRGLARPGRRSRGRSPGCARASRAGPLARHHPPDAVGTWTFAVEAFQDPYLTWRNAVTKKIAAGQGAEELANDLAEGARVLDRRRPGAGRRPGGRGAGGGGRAARRRPDAGRAGRPGAGPGRPALGAPGAGAGHRRRRAPGSGSTARGRSSPPGTSSSRAPRGRWSTAGTRRSGTAPSRTATRAAARRRRDGLRRALPAADPPDRPGQPQGPQQHAGRRAGRRRLAVGDRRRRGRPRRRSTPTWARRRTSAPSSPRPPSRAWRSRSTWRCSARPDHPWVTEHPEWFTTLPDGTIAYAENPPKKYQDIYPINFDNDPEGIRAEVLRVVLHWVGAGRADLPGRQPAHQAGRLLALADRRGQGRSTRTCCSSPRRSPGRPIMHGLGTIGFTQSYTYFTWRTTAARAAGVLRGAGRGGRLHAAELLAQHARTSCTSPCSTAARPMFKIRAVLAALLSPSWGVYAGYELFEHVARPGRRGVPRQREVRAAPRGLGRRPRRRAVAGAVPHPAQPDPPRATRPCTSCATCASTRSTTTALLCWSKRDPDTGNTVLVVCTFDPRTAHWGNTTWTCRRSGFDWHERFTVHDELTGAELRLGPAQRRPPRPVPATRTVPTSFTVRRAAPEPAVTGRLTETCPPTSPAAPRRRPARRCSMDAADRRRDARPARVLGAHPADGRTTIRTLRRGAGDVALRRRRRAAPDEAGARRGRLRGDACPAPCTDYRVEVDGAAASTTRTGTCPRSASWTCT